MNSEDIRRIDHVWYIVSLDLVRPFLKEMWFPFEGIAEIDRMRQQIRLNDDLPTYGSDPEVRVYRNLEWFGKEFGVSKLSAFLQWQRSVLPQDRIAESWWYGAIFQITRRSERLDLPQEIADPLLLVKNELAQLESQLQDRLHPSAAKLSEWDDKALKRQEHESAHVELQGILSMIAETIRANNLARGWRKHASGLDIRHLLQLREAAQEICTDFGGPPDGGVPLPGIWQPWVSVWLEGRT